MMKIVNKLILLDPLWNSSASVFGSREEGRRTLQKSDTRPFLSQSPNRVGSGPLGPPRSPGQRVTKCGASSCQRDKTCR